MTLDPKFGGVARVASADAVVVELADDPADGQIGHRVVDEQHFLGDDLIAARDAHHDEGGEREHADPFHGRLSYPSAGEANQNLVFNRLTEPRCARERQAQGREGSPWVIRRCGG